MPEANLEAFGPSHNQYTFIKQRGHRVPRYFPGLSCGGRWGGGRGGMTSVLAATMSRILVFIALLPLYATHCRRMFDVSATRRTVTSANAWCEHVQNMHLQIFDTLHNILQAGVRRFCNKMHGHQRYCLARACPKSREWTVFCLFTLHNVMKYCTRIR